MQFVKGKPPETQYATRPGARAKRREVALGRPGFEPGRIRAWLSLRPSQGHVRIQHQDENILPPQSALMETLYGLGLTRELSGIHAASCISRPFKQAVGFGPAVQQYEHDRMLQRKKWQLHMHVENRHSECTA
jgi:hypothetical protein